MEWVKLVLVVVLTLILCVRRTKCYFHLLCLHPIWNSYEHSYRACLYLVSMICPYCSISFRR